MADGKVIIETGLDDSGIRSDLGKLGSIAAKGGAVAVKAVAGVSTALTAAGGFAIKAGMDFEEGMSKVEAISGASAEDMQRLTDKAKEMGAKTKFSATESAAAFEYMAMAGWKTEDMLGGIEGIMDLAAASGEDLATTSDIVTDALTAFGLTASDSGHFADVLAAASSNANTNVGMMGETFKYVAPVAGALGFSAEDTATAIGLMANAGIKSSQAGTSLRSIMTRLAKPTDDVQAAMDDLGISLTNSDGSMKSLNEIMGDLRSGFSGLSEEQAAQMAATLGGQEAMSGLLAIVNASDADFEKLQKSIYNCDGTAKEMAETMQDNLAGKITLAKSAAEGFGIQVYESMEEPLKQTVEAGIGYIDQLANAFTEGGLQGAVEEAGDIFADIAVKAAEQAPKMVDSAVAMLEAFGKGIIKNRGKLYNSAVDIAKSLALGLVKVLPKEMRKPAEDAIKGLAKSLKSGGLKDGIDSAVKLLGNLADAAGKIAKAVLPPLTKALDFAGEHAVALGSCILIAVTAMKAFQITAAVTTAVKGLSGAFAAFNAVLLANPIGIVVAALSALATAFVIANLRSDESLSASELRQQQIDEENKKIHEQVEALKESREARQETVNGIESESGYYRDLWDEMQTIVDQNGKIKKGHEDRAQTIASLLSEELGITIDVVDGQIQQYDKLQQSIDSLIEKKRQEALMNAYQADYEEALKNRADAEETVVQKLKERDDALRGLADAQAYYDGLTNGTIQAEGDYTEACVKAEEAVKNKQDALDRAKTAYGEAQEALNLYTNDIANYETAMGAVKSGSEDASLYVTQMSHDFVRASGENKQALQDQVDKFRQGWQDMKTAAQQEGSGVTDAMVAQYQAMYLAAQAELAKGSGATEEQINSWMTSAKAALASAGLSTTGLETAQELTGGMTEGMETGKTEAVAATAETVEAINETASGIDTSEAGAQKATEFTDAETAGLKAGEEQVSEAAASNTQAINESASSVDTTTVATTIGSGTVQALINALSALTDTTRSAASDITTAVNQGLVSGGTEGASQAASNIGKTYAGAILKQQGKVINAGRQLARCVNAGTQTANATSAGVNVGTTFVAGIASKNGAAAAAGKTLATMAQTGVGSINVTQKGVTFGAWFITGINSKMSSSTSAGKTLANAAKNGLGSINVTSNGVNFASQYTRGVLAGAGMARGAGSSVANSALSGAASVSAYDVGVNFVSGFARGISANSYAAAAQASAMASAAKRAAAAAIDSHSPSRETYKLGKYFDQGFENAIADGTKDVEKAARNMSLSALSAADLSAMVEQMRIQVKQEAITIGNSITSTIMHKVTGSAKIEEEEKEDERRKLADEIVDAFVRAGIKMEVDDWTFGKLVREV